MSSDDPAYTVGHFLKDYLIVLLPLALTLVAVYSLYYVYKKQKFCFRPIDKDENITNNLRTLRTLRNSIVPEDQTLKKPFGSRQILQPSVIPCGFIDDTNFTDIDITDAKNDSAPSPIRTRCMPTQTSIKISTENLNPR